MVTGKTPESFLPLMKGKTTKYSYDRGGNYQNSRGFHRSAGLNEGPPSSSSGRNSPAPVLGSTPTDKVFDFPPGLFLGSPIAYPSPHLPPFPSPTLIQPVAQLRQPYIVTITSQVNLTGARGRAGPHNKRNSVPDDIPIRLAVTFAPSRARMLQGESVSSLQQIASCALVC